MAIAQTQEDDQRSFAQRVQAWPTELKDYVGELQAEMRRVTWPSWKQVRATTTVVILSVFAFAAYFFVVDKIVASLLDKIMNAFTR